MTYRIAVIPGDGIGKEVAPEGMRVLDAAGRKFGLDLAFDHFDWSCDYYAQIGAWMPLNWQEQLQFVWRHPIGPGPSDNRHDWHRSVGQPQP